MKALNNNSILGVAAGAGTTNVGTAAPSCPVERSSTAAAEKQQYTEVAKRISQRPLRVLSVLCGKSFLLAALILLAPMAWGQGMSKGIMSPPANVRPPYLQNVGIEQRLDAQVPGDLSFDEELRELAALGLALEGHARRLHPFDRAQHVAKERHLRRGVESVPGNGQADGVGVRAPQR